MTAPVGTPGVRASEWIMLIGYEIQSMGISTAYRARKQGKKLSANGKLNHGLPEIDETPHGVARKKN